DKVFGGFVLGEIVDMIQVKVAVAVARHTPGGPSVNERTQPGQCGFRERPGPGEDGLADRGAYMGQGLVINIQNDPAGAFEPAKSRYVRIRLGGAVKGGDPPGQCLNQLSANLAAGQTFLESRGVVEVHHLHGPLDDLAFPLELEL